MHEQSNGIFGFLLWLVWIVIVVLVLGGLAYLFVGGSTLFNTSEDSSVVVYRQLSDDGVVALSGSIVMPSSCYRLELETIAGKLSETLDFSFNNIINCDTNKEGRVPETFFTEFSGTKDTEIIVYVEGVRQKVIIK